MGERLDAWWSQNESEDRAHGCQSPWPSGEKVEGQLIQIDDFLVTMRLSDGSVRTISRNGRTPDVFVRDPLKAHEDMLPMYTDKQIHDVTAYGG